MKKKTLISSVLISSTALSIMAQVPSHPMYVQKNPTYVDNRGETKETPLYTYFENWQPGVPLTPDDNFFISRVRLKKRIENAATQVNPNMTLDRKLCWWCPIGISDKSWGSIPRYTFNADNFSMWQYLDIHGNWGDSWIRVTGGFSDAAHRNGVENGCVLFFDSSVSNASETGKIILKLTEKQNGQFKNAAKLIKFMKYYGIEGLGVNPEGALTSSMVGPLKEFFEECHKIAKAEDWVFKVHWYESMTNSGYVSWTDQLSMNNNEWFQREGKDYPVSDMFMLNYNWQGSKLSNSVQVAKNLGRSSYDVYAGFDAQGRWISDQFSPSPNEGWVKLKNNEASIAIWGSHTTNMIYENANEFGSDELTLQTTYQKKLEQFFTGGTRNPANCPDITNMIKSNSWNAMKNFHGMAQFLPARSAMTELPFITRFGLGNGMFFKVNGETEFPNKWYNIGVQDYLPTWRWWVLDDAGNVPQDGINCEFTFEDAWHAGSALKMYGATAVSNVRMFKTDFNVPENAEITVRYKIKNGTDPHLKLIWSADGATFKNYPMEATSKAGEWGYTTFDAKAAGMAGKVVSIGFRVEGTDSNYELLLGELAIDDKQVFTPAKPVITHQEILSGRYNEVDFKLIFKSKDQDPAKPEQPIYNDEVDTWYFEIYTQPEGGDPTLCTTTTSWASYVVGAPASVENRKNRFGVCAVAPDGVTRSEIAWTDYMERTVVQIDDVEIDKTMIKGGEEFTVRYVDPTHAKARSWEIVNSATGERKLMKANVTTLTTTINEEGSYDLIIKKDATDTHGTRLCGLIQISPAETGAIPTIGSLQLSKSEMDVAETTTASFTVSRLGEGKVSRGLAVRDPEMLRLPESVASANNYSIAMWFKVEKYAHGRFGTNLINKRSLKYNWPHNNWGDFWVHIWPLVYDKQTVPNEISFTQWNQYDQGISPGFNGNIHESPNEKCKTDGHGISPMTWNHLVISSGGGKMQIWLNGKKCAEMSIPFGQYRNGPVYIGGTNVYHGGLIGVIDELQVWDGVLDQAGVLDAMTGYHGRTIPANLKGYWDFETLAEDGTSFDNQGKGGPLKAQMIKFEGGGGESTGTTVETPVKANNNELGNPAITGSLEVKTNKIWNAPGATVTEGADNAEMKYASNGNYNVTLSLTNRWGTDSRTEAVVVTGANALDEATIAELSAYPNPFTDAVNVMFAQEGNYEIGIYALDGSRLMSDYFDAVQNEVIRIDLNAPQGIYILKVMKDNKCVQVIKLSKR